MKKKLPFFALLLLVMLLPLVANAQSKPCDPIRNLPWMEDFQAYPNNTNPPTVPNCWYFTGTNEPSIGQYHIDTLGSITHVLDLYSTGETYAVLQNEFDTILSVNQLQVTFRAGRSRDNSAYNSDLIIGVCSDPANPASTFVPIDTLLQIPFVTGIMTQYTIDFYSYSDTGRYFCFLTKPICSTGTNFLAVDSIVFDFNGHCMAPDNFHFSAVTDTSVNVAWSRTANMAYDLSYKAQADTAWSTPITVNLTNHTITGLTPSTTYDVLVRQNCGANGYSDWDTLSFTTDTFSCQIPTNLACSGVTSTSITYVWNRAGSASEWQLRVTNAAGYNQTFTATTPSYTVTGLTSGLTYSAQVRSVCDQNSHSTWSNAINTTTTSCPSVRNLAAQVTGHQVYITWTRGNSSAGVWQLLYGPLGFAEGQETGHYSLNSTYANISGLQDGVTYEARVRTDCGDSLYSGWSSVTFSTDNGGGENAIDNVENENLSIYPNPTSGKVTIALTDQDVAQGALLTVVDMTGRVVYTATLESSTTTIDMTGMARGAYFVKVNGVQINATSRLIVR